MSINKERVDREGEMLRGVWCSWLKRDVREWVEEKGERGDERGTETYTWFHRLS